MEGVIEMEPREKNFDRASPKIVAIAECNLPSRTNSNNGLTYLPVSPATSVHSNLASFYQDDEDLLNSPMYIMKVLTLTVLATILCLPLGCLAAKNFYQMKTNMKYGRKSRAVRHLCYASNLATASIVIGLLFWTIFTAIIFTQLVILKKSTEAEELI